MQLRPTHLLRILFLIAVVAACAIAISCGARPTRPSWQSGGPGAGLASAIQSQELSLAIAAQEVVSPSLLARADVAGTGASLDASGRAQVVVLLGVAGGGPLPATVNGVPILAWVTQPLRPWALTASYRPVPIGVAVGNANECLPGTIGCVLQRGSRMFLLSANHVFARQNQAAIGENIVQPSLPDLDPACGPAPSSAVVASLADFEPVVYDGKTPNVMDAAIAAFSLSPSQLSCATPAAYYGFPSSTVASAVVGMPVMKVGRTTELTRAQVKAVNVKVKITFPSGTALFVDQLLTTQGFGGFGDSGALVVTDDGTNRPVGIVIGGGSNGSAIVSPIGPILSRFSATVCSH